MKALMIAVCVLLFAGLGGWLVAQSTGTGLLGFNGQRVIVGSGLDLTGGVLTATPQPGPNRVYGTVLSPDPGDSQVWPAPAGASNVVVFRNGVRVFSPGVWNFVGGSVVFETSVGVQPSDEIAVDFDL